MGRRKAILWILSLGGAAASCGRLSIDNPLAFAGENGIDAPPELSAPNHSTAGLASAVGGPNALRVEWRSPTSPPAGLELALFVDPVREDVFGSTPIAVTAADGAVVLDPAPATGPLFVGLGARTSASDPFSPAGAVLRAHVGTTFYVDADAPPGGDGFSPSTPTDDLLLAGLLAFSFGGGSVWVVGGDYGELQLSLLDGVQMCGGFDGTFDLATRDAEANETLLRGLPELPVVDVTSVVTAPALDGFVLDGQGVATTGIQVSGSPLEVRRTRIGGVRRGLVLSSAESADPVEVLISETRVEGCSLEGLSLGGPFQVVLEGSTFHANGHEGVDFSNLIAPDGKTASLSARGCDFTSNGFEGLDADLTTPAFNAGLGGRFVFRIVDCDFEANRLTGLLVDIDFDLEPQWSLDVAILGCRSRANGLHGIRLDLDSTARAFVHRTLCSSNVGAGLAITSESTPGMAVVSSSAFLGNAGAGLLSAEGNAGVLASHCAFLGNLGGGHVNEISPGLSTSCAATQQIAPWPADGSFASVSQPGALPPVFSAAPREVARVDGFDGTFLFLSAIPGGAATAELADDGVLRAVVGTNANRVELDPPPTGTWTPATLSFFDPGVSAHEDWSPAPGSLASGAGMPPLAGPAPDAGPAGSPAGGAPGTSDPADATEPFRLAGTSPPWSLPIGSNDELVLSFAGGVPDAAAAPLGLTLRDLDGADLPVTAWVSAGRLHVAAPPGGWHTGERLLLLADLRASDGRPLGAPLALPLRAL